MHSRYLAAVAVSIVIGYPSAKVLELTTPFYVLKLIAFQTRPLLDPPRAHTQYKPKEGSSSID